MLFIVTQFNYINKTLTNTGLDLKEKVIRVYPSVLFVVTKNYLIKLHYLNIYIIIRLLFVRTYNTYEKCTRNKYLFK